MSTTTCLKKIIFFFLISHISYTQNNTKFNIKKKDSIIKVGLKAYFNRDTLILKQTTQKILSLYKNSKDSILLAKYYQYKAMNFNINYKTDSSYYYYSKSKDISKELNDSLEVGRRLLSMANLQNNIKDYLGSEITSYESLSYLTPIKAYKYLTSIHINLGLVFSKTSKFDQSKLEYDKALKIINTQHFNKKRKTTSYLYVLNNTGYLFQKQGLQKKAISYFLKGLSYDSIKEKYPENYSILLENLAYSNFLLGNMKNVLKQYLMAISINKENNNFYNLSTNYINISNYYSHIKKFKKAKNYSKKALINAKKSHHNKKWLEALQNLSQLSSTKESKQYIKQYIHLNDSLLSIERATTNQFAKIKFENEKREKENTFLKFENEKKQIEIVKQKQQNLTLTLLGLISVLGLLGSVLFLLLKRKKNLLQTELQKAKIKEEERSRISKELHDGILGKLFGIRINLGFLDPKTNSLNNKKYQDYLDELQNIEKEIREVSHKLSFSIEKSTDFLNIIEELFNNKSKIGCFSYQLHISSEIIWGNISDQIKINLHRIIHESLHNIIKHAKAKEVSLNIEKIDNKINTTLKDNGIGFNTDNTPHGIGLKNIKSRIEKLNGEITFSSIKEKGTTTFISIPV